MAGTDGAAAESGSGGKHKLLIIVISIVAAALVAVTAIVVLGNGGKGDEPKKEETGEHGVPPANAATSVFPLDPFIVNIYDGQEMRYLKVKVEFEMGPQGKQDLEAKQSPLRDAILVLLTTKTLQDIQDLQGKNQLKEEILAATNRLVGAGKVSKVYFTDFVVQ